MTGVKCWTCAHILMAQKIEQPKVVTPTTKVVTLVTCYTCGVIYRLTMEVVAQ